MFAEAVAWESTDGAAWAALGTLQSALGRFERAEASLNRAAGLGRKIPSEVWTELGLAQAATLGFAGAARAFSRAREADPNSVAIRVNLGNALRLVGRLSEAESELRKAVELGPDVPEAWDNLGLVLTAMGRFEEAVACHDACLEQHPGRALFQVHRGLALKASGREIEAEAAFVRALDLDRDCVEAEIQLGLLMGQQGDWEESLRRHQRAAALRPDAPEICNNLGNAFRALGRVEEAAACFERAVSLAPDFAEAHSNLAMTRLQDGEMDEALAGFTRAIDLEPGLAEAHVNRAHARLSLGDLTRGWAEFEWRRRLPDPPVGPLPGPEWDGEALEDQILIVHAEQGQGDTLQFVRFAADAHARGARVWIRVPRPLMSLLSRCPGVERAIPPDEPLPEAAHHIAMMSLPGRLRVNRLVDLGRSVPYLAEDRRLHQALRDRLGCREGLRIGISWQGNPRFPEDWHRSIALKEFLPLSRVVGVQCFVLQRGVGLDQLAGLPGEWRPRLLESPNHEEWAWEHTAALISHLDLVITSDSAVAHLAGAMGRPVWVALSAAADWRWFRDRNDSPWYPTMRLFRQTTWRTWGDVFNRIAETLAHGPAESSTQSCMHDRRP